MVSYFRHIVACNSIRRDDYVPFFIGEHRCGAVRRDRATSLMAHDDLFSVRSDCVMLADHLNDFASRSHAFDQLADRLVAAGAIKEKQNELYPVSDGFRATPIAALDRKLLPLFGVRAYGVHLNGFVRHGDRLDLWVGKRADDKAVAPGKLDNLVAGGQPLGLSALDNLIKECAEEADMPAELARRATPVGAISYVMEHPDGLRDDVLFVYDLEVPVDFVPRNTDGELQGFFLWPLDRVAATVRDTDEFKFNVALVIIDFLIRHGKIGPDDPGYLDLVRGLRV